jgi:murein L,D-transpeptidase YcbB/YkuD
MADAIRQSPQSPGDIVSPREPPRSDGVVGRMRLLLLLFILLMPIGAGAATADLNSVTAALPSAIERLRERSAIDAGMADDLQRFYRVFAYEPVWHLSSLAESRAVTARAAAGLDATTDASAETPEALAERDVALSAGLLAHAVRVRTGRVLPSQRGDDWAIPAERFDPVVDLADAIRTDALANFLQSLPPPHQGYRALEVSWRTYRGIVERGGWPLVPESGSLQIDSGDPRLAVLRARLEIEGDLRSGESLAAGVRRFQERHGLEPDGRPGRRTLAELNVPAEKRLAQIALGLERWRWMPRRLGDDHVIVNVPAATLTLVQKGIAGRPVRVVVGDEDHPTPSIAARITAVTLNPPWRVPTSIATREILPKLRRNPGYLAANNFVILGRPDDPTGSRVDWQSIPDGRFPFALQQQPGPRNALGLVKFEMPNKFDIYLHDTPGRQAFSRSDRALSHGCIRVQNPMALAAALLDDAVSWSESALNQEVAEGETRRLTLARSLPVYLTYFTAFVDEDGRTQFRRDLYGRDADLQRQLDEGGGSPLEVAALP